MKSLLQKFLPMVAIVLLLGVEGFSQCDSVNAIINSKLRYLGDWQPNGRPLYLEDDILEISDDVLNFVNEVLPESASIVESGIFNDELQSNTEITDSTDLYMTFVSEGADWKNVLGYYTYDLDSPPSTYEDIDSMVVIFPNVSAPGVIKKGERVHLGTFPPNTGVGYFLIADGYKTNNICIKDHIVFTDKHLNTFADPQYRQHTVLLSNTKEQQYLLGMEDQARPSGDNDFNDAVFYIEGNINDDNIPIISIAEISGDTVLCDENDLATVTIDIIGTPPFDIVYNNGIENVEITDIQTTTYSFETAVKNIFTLVSVENQYGKGMVSGEANVQLSQLAGGVVNEENSICKSGDDVGLQLYFKGFPPYTLKYTENGVEKEIVGIMEDTIDFVADPDIDYEFVSLSDNYCSINLGKNIDLYTVETPGVQIEIPEVDCENPGLAKLLVNFTGEPPYTFQYSISGTILEKTIESSSFELDVPIHGIFEFLGFSGSNCPGVVPSTFTKFQNAAPPKANFVSDQVPVCEEGSEVELQIELEGITPITFELRYGDQTEFITTDDLIYTYVTNNIGTYSIKSVSNAFCQTNDAASTVDINVVEKPTFELETTANEFCEGGSGTLSFNFTGVAPWSFTLTNGSYEESFAVNENPYEVQVSDPGDYSMTNFSDANCSVDVSGSQIVSFNTLPQPMATISGGGEFCGETQSVDITFELAGEPPFNVVYTDGEEEFDFSIEESSYSVSVTNSGTYSIVSFSNASCEGAFSGEAIVNNLGDIEAEIEGPDFSCQNETIALSLSAIDESITSINWTTTGSGEIKNNGTPDIVYEPADGESGEITFDVTLANTCGQVVLTKAVNIIETPTAEFTIMPDELFSDSDITFTAEDVDMDSYQWNLGDGGENTGEQFVYSYNEAGNYIVTLKVEIEGCSNESLQEIIVLPKNELFVPNVFNPNALHPENRVVKVYGTNVSENGFVFKIVNRWGNTIYQTTSFITANTEGWDGEKFNVEEEQSLNAFTYILRGQFADGQEFERTGTITMLQ